MKIIRAKGTNYNFNLWFRYLVCK